MKKFTFLVFLFVISFSTYAQISSYTFSQTTNAYTEVTGGTLLGSETTNEERFVNPAAPLGSTSVLTGVGFPIGFSFIYNGEAYDRFSVVANGWISLGKSSLTPSVDLTSSSASFPLNSTTAMNESLLARIAGFSRDLVAQPGASLRFETIGTAPNRTLVIQWKNYRKSSSEVGGLINFQIRLDETTNVVSFAYGTVSTADVNNNNVQVGLRAAPLSVVSNYLSRTSATSWITTTAGLTAPLGTQFVNFTNLIAPSNGLTFTYTPPACSAPAGFSVSGITNTGATINWEALAPAPTGYEYVLSTTNVLPTGAGIATTSATNVVNSLQSNTFYYVFLRTNCGTGFSDWSYVGVFKTLCDSVTDFVQNFDNFPTGTGNLPDCWGRAGTSANVYTTSVAGGAGTAPNRLYMNINATTTAFAIMPFVSNLQADTHRLKFKANASATGKALRVGYFTNPADVTSFVEIGVTPTLPNAFDFTNAQEYTFIPTGIPAGVNQLVFALITGSATTIYVDDVKWELNSSCVEPSVLTATAITSATAQLGWTAGGATAWEVQYGAVNFQLGTGTTVTSIATNPYTLTGLSGNTTYEYYVRGVCAGPVNSAWVGPFKFKTTCDPVVSFSENFGATVTYSGSNTPMPACWDRSNNGTTNRVNLTTITPFTVPPYNNKLAMSSLGATNGTQSVAYAMMPPVSSLQGTTHRLRFKGYTSSTGTPGIIKIGYLNDSYDVSTFTYLTEYELPQGAANQQQFIYNLPFALPATAKRLAFKFEGITTGTSQIFILLDDVNWEPIPTCFEPFAYSQSNVLSNAVTVSWTEPTPSPANGYEYYVSTSFVDPMASTVATGTIPAGATSAVIPGLLPSSQYYVWIRSVCSTTEKSIWTDYVTFKTLCAPVATLAENFDAFATGSNNPLPTCWDKLATIGNVYIATGSVIPATAPNRLYLTANGSVTSPAVAMAALPAFSNLQANTHRLRFKAYTVSGPNRVLEVGYLTDAYNAASFVNLAEFTMPDLAVNATEFFYTPGILPSNAVRLVFRNASIPTAVTTIYVDDVFWEPIPACSEVSNLIASDFQENSANVSWTAPVPAPSNGYAYYVTTTNVPPTSTTTPTGTTAAGVTTANLTGLLNSTQYFVWVRSVCATESSFWAGPVSFFTECPPVTAFSQNFDTAVVPSLPTCWSKILRGETSLSPFATIGTSNVNTSSFPNFTTPNSVAMAAQTSGANADIILVSPKVSNLGAGTHRLKFHSYYPGDVQVGTLNNNDPNSAVFTPLQTVTLNGLGSLQVVNFNTYTGTDDYIGIRLVPNIDTFPSINIDNVIWEPIPLCSDVTNVTVVPGATSATVSWTSGSASETSWQVAVGAATVTDPNTLTALPATTTSLVVSDLTPNTPYKAWVRAICGANIGNWILATFTTICAPQNVPYSQNFESAVVPAIPSCTSELIASGFGNVWQTQIVNASGFSSTLLRNPNPPGNVMDAWFFTNGVNLVQGQSYTISYKKGTNNGVSFHNLRVKVGATPSVAAMTTTLAEHVGFAGTATTENISFTVPTTGVYYFGFQGYSNGGGSLYLDDILVDGVTPCTDVTGVTVVPTTTSATVSWTAGSTAETSWQVAVGATTVTDPNTLTALPATTTSLVVNDLTAGTSYNVWVRSNCGNNNFGAWVLATFSTLCTPQNVPYSEDFNSAVIPSLPTCTSQAFVSGYNWDTSLVNSVGFSSQTLRHRIPPFGSGPVDVWFFTKGLNLVQGQAYTISYKKGTVNTFLDSYSLKVALGSTPTIAAMTTTVANHVAFTGNATTETISFTVPTTGVYYFGFQAYNAFAGSLFVDDILVDVDLSNGDFDLTNFSYYPNPVTDILTVSYSNVISDITAYNMLGQQVMQVKSNATTAKLDMSNLSKGTYMVKVTSENQVKTVKVIKN